MSAALEKMRGQPALQPIQVQSGPDGVRTEYLQSLRLIERLHRLLLDVIKSEFDRQGEGELKTRGYYLGSNVSYNLKKLVDMDYIHYKRSETDKRQVRVSLTEKGKTACAIIHKLYQRQLGSIEAVGQVSQDDLKGLNRALGRLERFWSDQIRFRL